MPKKKDLSPAKQAKDNAPRGRETVWKKQDPSSAKEIKTNVRKGQKKDISPAKKTKDNISKGKGTMQKKKDPSPAKQANAIVPRVWETVQKKRDPSPAKQPEKNVQKWQKPEQRKIDLSPAKQEKPILTREQETVQKKIDQSPAKVQDTVRRINILPAKPINTLPNKEIAENERKVQLRKEQKKVIQNQDLSPMNKIEKQTPERQNAVKQEKNKEPQTGKKYLKVQFVEPLDIPIAKPQKQPENQKCVKQSYLTSIQDYRLGRMLGKGSFGRVFLALHKPSNRNVAIKALSKTHILNSGLTKKVFLD
ncbi:calcium-dependent protein kinase 2-like [Xenopus tropicalis]|uniref:Calcium-dependent protein kinase 2-like n=1 Tax=Xenopus tropicalis TaxID=8364 RepID=A0A8J1JSR8_XENTR|nr:calcium-dependent protein kinase 2-like [Xenopus tropicalis]